VELVIFFEEQCVAEIVDIPDGVPIGVDSLRAVPLGVVAAHQLDIVQEGHIEVQAGELVTSLDPPTMRMQRSGVRGFQPGVDVFTFDLDV